MRERMRREMWLPARRGGSNGVSRGVEKRPHEEVSIEMEMIREGFGAGQARVKYVLIFSNL